MQTLIYLPARMHIPIELNELEISMRETSTAGEDSITHLHITVAWN